MYNSNSSRGRSARLARTHWRALVSAGLAESATESIPGPDRQGRSVRAQSCPCAPYARACRCTCMHEQLYEEHCRPGVAAATAEVQTPPTPNPARWRRCGDRGPAGLRGTRSPLRPCPRSAAPARPRVPRKQQDSLPGRSDVDPCPCSLGASQLCDSSSRVFETQKLYLTDLHSSGTSHASAFNTTGGNDLRFSTDDNRHDTA